MSIITKVIVYFLLLITIKHAFADTALLLELAMPAKQAVADYVLIHTTFPSSNAQALFTPSDSKEITSLNIGPNGVITMAANSQNLGLPPNTNLTLLFLPTFVKYNGVMWSCLAEGDKQYAPVSCQ